jgi:hypothetical protein
MMWREIKIALFISVLCVSAALATVAIYTQASGRTASAWLLAPLFGLIAIAVLASEVLAHKSKVKDNRYVAPISVSEGVLINPSPRFATAASLLMWSVGSESIKQVYRPQVNTSLAYPSPKIFFRVR